ncbi:hypothetical protein EDD90_5245 [Streptomyces sp. Ag109_O5-1]|nr:hypothetical protein [Streptomyces sp. Ag109_O5-1]RPE42140.1 hypothetical protein EDD90_5245 [Streptomyces sp. Ag109_O5-1]
MRIALSQLITGPGPGRNLPLVEEWTRRAADAGARVVVFPEASMACFGTPLSPLAEPLDGPWADGVRRIARHALGAGPELPVADLDIDEVAAVRRRTSVLANRRPEVWR